MRVTRIVLQDFRSYEFLDLDLSELETVAIVGKVGAGKTALVEAITYGLWGKIGRRAFIRDDADECVVQVDFIARGNLCSVIRTTHVSGRNSTLSLIINGVNSPRHTKGETQAEIERLIGLDYESIIAGPFMLQGDSAHLMQTSPSGRKDLLIRLFGVDQYEVYHREALTRGQGYARDAEQEASEADRLGTVAAAKGEATDQLNAARLEFLLAVQEREKSNVDLTTAREQQVALREQARHADTLRQTVTQLGARIQSDEQEYNRVLRQVSDAHQMVATPAPEFPALIDVSPEAIEDARQEVQTLTQGLTERQSIEARLPGLLAAYERSRKLAAIVDIVPCGGQGIYASCRFLTSAPKAGEIEAQAAEIDDLTAKVPILPGTQAVMAATAAHSSLVEQRHGIERQRLQQEAQTQQWDLKMASARQTVASGQDSLKRLEAQVARDTSMLERATQQLAEFRSDAALTETVDMQVRSLKEQVDEQTRSIEMLYQPAVARAEERLATVTQAEADLPAVTKRLNEARAKAKTYTLLAKAFHRDGIPTLILENGIPIIEEHANEILARMPGNYRLHVATQREKKTGGMAERVDVLVERVGGIRHYEDLSGGQAFRVDFAMRIALARVLTNRSGSPIETLILDEGWETQDKDGIEALLESIAAVQDQFKLVLIITHQEAVSERFQTRLEPDLAEDGTSSVTLVA